VFNPQPIQALQGVRITQIACGDSHCLAVTVAGHVHRYLYSFMYYDTLPHPLSFSFV
jgi:alpha-tubulin suppressor-like RCC1 family protein